MNKTLTADARATIMDACQSISRSADALKAGCSIDGEWPDADDKAFYDAELRLLGRLTALLAAQQPEPRAHLTDDHRDKIERAEERLRGRGPEDVEIANGLLDVLTAHPVEPEPRAEVTDDDVAKLKRFAGLVLKDHRNGGYPGDVDGGELQAYAEQCGLIEERRVESPCGENCSCTDFGEFPTTCYFNTDLGKAVIDAARAGEGQC
ncbi:hypothetical protein [Burkholderia sp. LMG 13014]|uniref:hypothetical protein n=1 Tax=Burkholderia sp. LMG 13014 TaxID=2709306 RepID=UPI0019626EDA|nr:hypothetical protein [Burkholderia sp. LMG 13014]